MIKIHELSEQQQCDLIENRWTSSESIWDIVQKTYDANTNAYKNSPAWLQELPRKKSKVRANRIFVDMEAVINSVIANPPKPIVMSGRPTPTAKELAMQQEKYFLIKYTERNSKETLRKGLRNLYFARLIVLKKFWDPKINDFNTRALDPRKVRFGKASTKEDDSEFAIEEIDDNITAVMRRFPKKADQIMKLYGFASETEAFIMNPSIKYKEAWIRDYVLFKIENIILGCIKNPYWDWDGLLITQAEADQLMADETVGDARRAIMSSIKDQQPARKANQAQTIALATAQSQYAGNEPQAPGDSAPPVAPETGVLPLLENQEIAQTYQAYYFNHFDQPRKPYIFATMFNNENTPIGQTDMITQAIPLQENVDETKRDITENAKVVNGTMKVDASVMSKADAQRIRYEAGGVLWGKGVVAGVQRETGEPLPAFVINNLQDSRQAIDDAMASSSAFKGEREGQETKGGRLALIEQSFLRLNELVQVIDYVTYESFNWDYQLAKIRYTEHHYAKTMGKQGAAEVLSLIQDDFLDGSEIRVISGKTLPEDSQFKYEQAQEDVKTGIISHVDYLEIANYNNPKELAKNAFMEKAAPMSFLGLTDEDKKSIPPPIPQSQLREQIAFDDLPDAAKVQFLARMGIIITADQMTPNHRIAPVSLNFKDLPPDGQVQLAAQAGVKLNPQIVVAEKMNQMKTDKEAADAKAKGMVKSPIQPTK